MPVEKHIKKAIPKGVKPLKKKRTAIKKYTKLKNNG